MCGIHLIIDKTATLRDHAIHAMAGVTRYRGPDDTQAKIIKRPKHSYHLAVNRLMITDKSDVSAQPFMSEDGRYALLFNGEIYNYHTLKNELLTGGIRFQSHSDTEVLFQWLMRFGSGRIDELNGMFAFIFIDFQKEEFFVARDDHGIKPVYYFHDDKYLIISSEIQPILRTGLVSKNILHTSVLEYLQLKYVPAPRTFFQDVYEIMPGYLMEGNVQTVRKWSFQKQEKQIIWHSPDISKIGALLRDSLLQQITAPVPVGLLLSGGVDSTLLLAIAHREGFSLPAFSIVNSSKDRAFGTQDYRFAAKAAQRYGSEHHALEVDISILDQFHTFVQKLDQPIGDVAYLLTSEICGYASDTMKVLLSGAGADELFGGYNRHWAFYQYLKYRKWLRLLNPAFRISAKVLPAGFAHPWRKHVRLYKKLINSMHSSPEVAFLQFVRFQEMEDDTPKEQFSGLTNNSEWMAWALDHDLGNYLVQDVLALSDRASMWHSVELRVPYLDQELVRYMQNVAPQAIMKRGRKWILKELLAQHGGKEFADRPKEGFGMPLAPWLIDKKMDHLWRFAQNSDHPVFGYINKDLLEKLLNTQRRKAEDHGQFLWSVLILAHWLEHQLG